MACQGCGADLLYTSLAIALSRKGKQYLGLDLPVVASDAKKIILPMNFLKSHGLQFERLIVADHMPEKDPVAFSLVDESHREAIRQVFKETAFWKITSDGSEGPIEKPVAVAETFRAKNVGGLIAKLTSAKDVARSVESNIRRPMRAYGYRGTESHTRNVGGETAEGFSYEYEVNGSEMYAESDVVKRGRELYYLHFYSSAELKEDNLKIWTQMLASSNWL